MGIWLFSDRDDLPASLPRVTTTRDAIHLPSVDKNGTLLSEELVNDFLAGAWAIGLVQVHRARGYWTLSETGELQDEDVRIAFSAMPVDPAALRALADKVLLRGNQDAVAFEIAGQVLITSGDS